jgi:hypothetical protein
MCGWPWRRWKNRRISANELGLVTGPDVHRKASFEVNTMKCIRPFVLIADIAFTENRLSVRRTT